MNALIKVAMDPTGHFRNRDVSKDKLLEAMGLIPYFAVAAAAQLPKTAEKALELMDLEYGFGMGAMTGAGTVDEDGVYEYPEDPPLYPMAAFRFPESDVTVYVYQYAMVAVVDPETTLITRMD